MGFQKRRYLILINIKRKKKKGITLLQLMNCIEHGTENRT